MSSSIEIASYRKRTRRIWGSVRKMLLGLALNCDFVSRVSHSGIRQQPMKSPRTDARATSGK